MKKEIIGNNEKELLELIQKVTGDENMVVSVGDNCIVITAFSSSPESLISVVKNCVGNRLVKFYEKYSYCTFIVSTEEGQKISQKEIFQMFNSLFGEDVHVRNQKLKEEVFEYFEAAKNYWLNPSQEAYDAMIDELSDTMAVMLHICSILDKTPEQLLLMAYDKVKGRLNNQNYKRSHPHKEKIF